MIMIYVHSLEKNQMVNNKVRFATLTIVFYPYWINKL